jgi:hypothetical protein
VCPNLAKRLPFFLQGQVALFGNEILTADKQIFPKKGDLKKKRFSLRFFNAAVRFENKNIFFYFPKTF